MEDKANLYDIRIGGMFAVPLSEETEKLDSKKAKESLNRDNHQQGQCQNPNPQQEASSPAGKGNDEKGSEKHQEVAAQLPDDVQDILDEEKENTKRRNPRSRGGYRAVDKDW